MRRFIALLAVIFVPVASACASSPEDCDHVEIVTPPVDTVRSYKIVIHKDVPADRVGLILDATDEWVIASSGKVVFEVTYADFPYKETPKAGEMRIYTEAKADKSSNTIGLATSWGKDEHGRPAKSRIWIQSDLDPRTYFLTTMHEVGHGLGLPHYELKDRPAIMFPFITDVGDHPTCADKQKLCQLWECAPGC